MADEITYDVFLSHNSQNKPAFEARAHSAPTPERRV
jgi:hypothetical protein